MGFTHRVTSVGFFSENQKGEGAEEEIFSPGFCLNPDALAMKGPGIWDHGLEYESRTHNDATVSAIRGPLVKEGSGRNACRRDPEVTRIGGIEHVGA